MNHEQNSSPARERSNGNGLSSARRQPARSNGHVTATQFKRLSERVEQVEAELHEIKNVWDRMETTREQIEKNGADLSVQFQRIAMMQAEIDRLKASERALETEIDRLRAENTPVGPNATKRTAPTL